MHRFSVLGDGAPCHHDALFRQQLGDAAVAERLARVFRRDQSFDERADCRRRAFAARLGGDMA